METPTPMSPDPVELPAIAVGGIVGVRIGVDPEGERREEAEAIMVMTVPVMIAIPAMIAVMIMIMFLTHPHSSHVVLHEPARGRI
jgi:hypothetical protein